MLSESTLELTKFTDTRIEGNVNCNRAGLLYTSIPQDGNWTAYVDGKPTEIVLVGNAMCCVHLEEGSHTVTFQYENKAFSLGWKISLGCLVVFLGICLPVYIPNRKKKMGKYEQ